MKRLTTTLCLTLLMLAGLPSCSKSSNEPTYKGENQVVLKFDSSTPTTEELTVGADKEVTLVVLLTNKTDKQLTVTLAPEDDTVFAQHFNATPATATIAAGSREAKFTIKPKDILLSEKKSFSINVKITPATDLKMPQAVSLTLAPSKELSGLTAEQIALLDGYRTKLGIDVASLLGTWVCQGAVHEPGGSNYPNFTEKKSFAIKDEQMHVTLSDLATADKPILKFEDNAMGLKGYLGEAFRRMTILDKEFWNNEGMPNSIPLMKMVNWTEQSEETYTVDMDFIELRKGTTNAKFITPLYTIVEHVDPLVRPYEEVEESIGVYLDNIHVIPFIFHFSPFDRLLDVYRKDKNTDMRDMLQQSNINPYQIMFHSNSDEDGWAEDVETTNFVDPVLTIDPAKGEMVFKAAWDNNSDVEYTVFDIKATKKN